MIRLNPRLIYFGFQQEHLAILEKKAETSSAWAQIYRFVERVYIQSGNPTIKQAHRLRHIRKSLEKTRQNV